MSLASCPDIHFFSVLQRALTLLAHEKRVLERCDLSPDDRAQWHHNRQLANLTQQELPYITHTNAERVAISALACLNVATSLCADQQVMELNLASVHCLAATAKRVLTTALEE